MMLRGAAFLSVLVVAMVTIGFRSESPTPEFGYRVVNAYPHDPRAFTQGLVFVDDSLYESTGLRGQSSLRRVELATGRVVEKRTVLPLYFAEGLTIKNDRVFQLTWTSGIGFVYDRETLNLVREFRYGIEGWGITHDGTSLIVSDGSSTLYFWDPETFSESRRLTVRDTSGRVENLNELEYIDGEIYANVWMTDRIARISPETGRVSSWIDLDGLLPEGERSGREDVLNGIAYDADGGRLFVTGKLWPKLFEIELVPK